MLLAALLVLNAHAALAASSQGGLTIDGHPLLGSVPTTSAFPALNVCSGSSVSTQSVSSKPSGDKVVALFQSNLTDSTLWTIAGTIPLQIPSIFHPQGLLVLNGDIYITTVEVLDRPNGKGRGYLLRFAANGTLLGQVQLGPDKQPAYHAGGCDTDGSYIYVPLAEYHSSVTCGAATNCTLPGTSYIYRVTPDLKEVTELFSYPDHVGGLTLSGTNASVIDGNTWGSRTFYRWSLPGGQLLGAVKNQNYMIEYQDCKALTGCSVALCSGIKNFLYQRRPDLLVGDQTVNVTGNATKISFQSGGLALVDPVTGVAIDQVPVPAILTPLGNSLTINPMWVTDSFNGTNSVQFLFAPDDVNGSVVVVRPQTP